MPIPNSVASIPTDRISATGISFPVPSMPQAQPSSGASAKNVPVAPNPVSAAPGGQYCLPAGQGNVAYANPAAPNAKVSVKIRYLTRFIYAVVVSNNVVNSVIDLGAALSYPRM